MSGVVFHEFTSPQIDATGTLTVGIFPNTSTVEASEVVQPSHWNSGHLLAQGLIGNTVGVSSVSGTNIFLSAGANITLSGVQGIDVATIGIAGGAGGGGAVSFSAGTSSAALDSVVFADGNNVSFGLDGSTITASIADYAGTGTTFAGANISGSLTLDSAGLNLSLSGLAALTSQSNQALSAANGSFTFQTAQFSNANGVSFQTSAGSAIAASVETSYVRPGFTTTTTAGTAIVGTLSTNGLSMGVPAFLTTARASTDAVGLNTAQTNVTWTVNSSGISLNAAGYAGTATTFNGASISGSITLNSVGLNLSLSVGAYLTSQSNQAASAANGSFAFQTISFSNLNGISFGTSAGSAITASHNALTSQSNQAFSAGAASSTFQTLTFQDSNGLSFSNNAGAIRVTYTVPVVSNAIQSVGSATAAGTNTSRFAADDHVHAGVFSMGVSTGGNTAGNTRVDVGRFVILGSDNITLSQITAANALNTIAIIGGAGGAGETRLTAYAVSNTTQATSGTIPLSLLSFQGAGAASVGISNGSVVISAPNAAAGNVTFSAGSSSAGLASVVFSGSNGFEFQLDGSTISGGPVMESYFNNGPQVSGVSGQIIGANTLLMQPFLLPYPLTMSFVRMLGSFSINSTSVGTSVNTSISGFYRQPICLVIYSLGTGASSNSFMSIASTSLMLSNSMTLTAGAVGSNWTSGATYNYGDRGSVATYTTAASVTQSRFDASSAHLSDFNGLRFLDIPFALSLPPGPYWLGIGANQSDAGNAIRNASIQLLNVQVNRQLNSAWNRPGAATNSSNNATLGLGSYSIAASLTTNPISQASVPLANISSGASHTYRLFEMMVPVP